MEDLIGINEEGLDKLALEIYDYAERINKLFIQIDDLIFQSADVFKCDIASSLLKKYKEKIRTSYSIINANIQSYSSDLINAKNSFRNRAASIALDVRQRESDIQSIKG